MLSDKIKADIKVTAKDPGVQMCCVNAMFNECERGGDLWEALEESSSTLLEGTKRLFWGPPMIDEDDPEEEHERQFIYCLSNRVNNHEVIDYLLDQVEVNLRKKVGV